MQVWHRRLGWEWWAEASLEEAVEEAQRLIDEVNRELGQLEPAAGDDPQRTVRGWA